MKGSMEIGWRRIVFGAISMKSAYRLIIAMPAKVIGKYSIKSWMYLENQ